MDGKELTELSELASKIALVGIGIYVVAKLFPTAKKSCGTTVCNDGSKALVYNQSRL